MSFWECAKDPLGFKAIMNNKSMIFLQNMHECRLSIELLDTDHDLAEGATEVEKWSQYVEKYIANDETITEELKEQLTKKPVFLPRSVKKAFTGLIFMLIIWKCDVDYNSTLKPRFICFIHVMSNEMQQPSN